MIERVWQAVDLERPFHLRLGGEDGRLADRLVDQWFLPLPEANPLLLGVYSHRETVQPRALLPWHGEFAGKYLTAAAEVWSLCGRIDLKEHLDRFVAELDRLQADDGYLGPWDREHELTGTGRNVTINFKDSDFAAERQNWDAWGHYHIMIGCVTWYELTANSKALEVARRIVSLFCDRFLATGRRLVDIGDEEMNMAALHGIMRVQRHTRDERALELAKQLVDELPVGKAGDYMNGAAAGRHFHELPGPRWESLHILQGLAELGRATGEERFAEAVRHFWWSLAESDVHNTFGFSSGESAVGNPYSPSAIETCCTVAWMALCVDMVRLTGESYPADYLELAHFNGGLGSLSPSGRWSTYNTPMDGVRLSSQRDIMFQSRPGSPELSCCSVNAQRLLGMAARWGVMRAAGGALVVNYYGESSVEVGGEDEPTVKLVQETDYPVSGRVRITVTPERPVERELRLRIPAWSRRTRIVVSGEEQPTPAPGAYLPLARSWTSGDVIEIELDMSPWYWAGERECEGRASVYRGPILLTRDTDYTDSDDPDPRLVATDRELEVLDAPAQGEAGALAFAPRPRLLVRHPAADGSSAVLCDFASAGQRGNWYRSWLVIDGPQQMRFTKENPLRAWHPAGGA